MPINPNISLQYQPIQMPSEVNALAKLQQFQAGQQAQQLNALKLQQAQKSLAEQEALSKLYSSGLDMGSPEAQSKVLAAAPTTGFGVLKSMSDMQKSQAELASSKLKAASDKLNLYSGEAAKGGSYNDAIAFHNKLLNDPALAPLFQGVDHESALRSIPQDPEALKQWWQQEGQMGLNAAQRVSAAHQQIMEGIAGRNAASNEMKANAAAQRTNFLNDPLGLNKLNAPSTSVGNVPMTAPVGTGGAPGTTPEANKPPIAPTTFGEKNWKEMNADELKQALPPSTYAEIEGIANYTIQPPSVNSAAGQQMLQLAKIIDPTYDIKNFNNQKAYERSLTAGPIGDTVQALDTAHLHLDTLGQLAENLNNTNSPLFNKLANEVKKQTGKTAPTDFAAAKQIVADEIIKATIGSKGALGDRTQINEAVNAANSPDQLRNIIRTYKNLIAGRLQTSGERYERITGKKDFFGGIVKHAPNPNVTNVVGGDGGQVIDFSALK